MDRNTIVGIVVIIAIIIGFSLFNKPSEEELAEMKRKSDSIAEVNRQINEEKAKLEAEASKADALFPIDTTAEAIALTDSMKNSLLVEKYGVFAGAMDGERKFITMENEFIRLTFSNVGGKIYSVQLKEYQTWDSLPLILFNGDSTVFGLKFFAQNKSINTNDLFFSPLADQTSYDATNSTQTVKYRLAVDNSRYIEYEYSLEPGKHMVDFKINMIGIDNLMSSTSSYFDLDWSYYVPRQEKGRKNENTYTAIYFKHFEDEVDNLAETKSDEVDITTALKWVAFKQQFFSSVLIAENSFANGNLRQEDLDEANPYLKKYNATIGLKYDAGNISSIPMKFYFGPNHFNTLKKYDLELEKLIPLGWGIFGWINRIAVIPVFNFLDNYISSYGIIILILTILLKLVLLPLTFKSYMSSAKMRVLKPQIDEINKKIPKEKSMERQQATMALYKKVGVSPMGGCLPMLVQFPILIAMFRFFPASIELRQKSFLWAQDLSTYDSIWTFPNGFEIPWYGDHISLFTILMTVSTIIYTRVQQDMNPGGTQMPGMKFMMYLFPIMFLFFLNNYASGLSYYYFVANILTFGQMWLFKRFVDDEAVLKKLEVSKKKPVKKSKFQDRLEKMAKQSGRQLPKK